jgi:hypothetical protein
MVAAPLFIYARSSLLTYCDRIQKRFIYTTYDKLILLPCRLTPQVDT